MDPTKSAEDKALYEKVETELEVLRAKLQARARFAVDDRPRRSSGKLEASRSLDPSAHAGRTTPCPRVVRAAQSRRFASTRLATVSRPRPRRGRDFSPKRLFFPNALLSPPPRRLDGSLGERDDDAASDANRARRMYSVELHERDVATIDPSTRPSERSSYIQSFSDSA